MSSIVICLPWETALPEIQEVPNNVLDSSQLLMSQYQYSYISHTAVRHPEPRPFLSLNFGCVDFLFCIDLIA